jgi:hypothetical protein
VEWIYLAQDELHYRTLVNTSEPLDSIEGDESLDRLSGSQILHRVVRCFDTR